MADRDAARFLGLAPRAVKPRRSGVTHVIDTGRPLDAMDSLLDAFSVLIDVWKFGFGTAYTDASIGLKVAALKRRGVKACPGGTLLEAAWLRRRTEAFFGWALGVGFDCVEVSRGASELSSREKSCLIGAARDHGFEVFAELGSKDPRDPALPNEWAQEARRDADSGAAWLIAEGRESGTVGLYDAEGMVRVELVDALEALPGSAPVIYEAPRRHQQAWLVQRLGADANLANVKPDEILALEALRLGLRSDTIAALRPPAPGPKRP